MPPKNSGGSTKFPGGHRVIHRTAQTAFVRVVTPRVKRLKAALVKVIQDVAMCANILKQTCEILMFIHERGFFHNDLKSSNVLIIDFGKSCKIVKARLREPKVNIEKSMNKFPHIAPEIHRGERHSIASDVFSFGYLVTRLFKGAKLEIPPVLKEVAKKFQRSIPGKHPKLVDFFTILTKSS